MSSEKIEKFAALIARDPTDELARFTLARAFLDAGRTADARAHFEVLVAQKPDWLMAWLLLGRTLADAGDRDAARAAITTARELAIAQNHKDPQLEAEELLEELGS